MKTLGCWKSLLRSKRVGHILPTFSLAALLLLPTPLWASHNGGVQPPPGPLPPASVTPLPSDAPAPWGTDPATLPGATISDTIKGNGFLQETVSLQNGDSFFFQSITTPDFSVDSYVKRTEGASNDPDGNIIFNQVLKDPAWGLTDRSSINGFKQPIQLHFDIVESKVAQLTDGFNQMDMHFRQQPFLDTATGKIRVRQDVGVWITSFIGVRPPDITTDHRFAPGEANMSHEIARAIGGFGGGDRDGGRRGRIDFWNDLEVVKIIDPMTNQLVTFSKCSDAGDPSRRGDFEMQEDGRNDRGTRGGCFGGTGVISRPLSFGPSFRPDIPNHDSDSFQLTPINWERWGGGGSGTLGSGGNGGLGGLTIFPSTERFRNDP